MNENQLIKEELLEMKSIFTKLASKADGMFIFIWFKKIPDIVFNFCLFWNGKMILQNLCLNLLK